MKRAGIAVLSCLSIVLASACGDSSGPGGNVPRTITSLPRSLSGAEQGIIAATNGFGFQLLGRINSKAPTENHFLSPLSASMALGMLMNGASGTTQDEMRTTLGFGAIARPDVIAAYRDLIALLRGLDAHVDFRIANSIFYRDAFGPFIEPSYLSESKSFFDATAAALDFNSPSALTTINDWAKTATNGKIPKVLNQLDADLVMVLMNAIYFKGDWRQAFDPKKTSNAPFTPEGRGAVPVPMMHLTDTMRVATVPRQPSITSDWKWARACATVICVSSAMPLPCTSTERAARFRRAPPHSGQGRVPRYLPSSSRTAGDSVSRHRRSRFGTMPSKGWLRRCVAPRVSL